MKLKMKYFNIWAFIKKSDFQRGDFAKKPIKRRDCVKRGASTVCRFKGSCKKEGVAVFEGGLIPQRILCFLNKLKGKGRPFLEGPKKGATL